MDKIKCVYYKYKKVKGKEIKQEIEFVHESYCCPHCEGNMFFVQADIGRSLVACNFCDYSYWAYPNGKTEEIDRD